MIAKEKLLIGFCVQFVKDDGYLRHRIMLFESVTNAINISFSGGVSYK